jgi:tRNA(fMet)-specific endonuclease VapC
VKPILLDTNAYVAFRRGDPAAVAVLRRAPEIALCPTVLGELLAGFTCGSHNARNRRSLADFLVRPRVRVLEVDTSTAEHYASVFALLRRKGRPVPTNDIWIAATALQHGYAVYSLDEHFAAIDNLIVGAELSAFLP